MLSTEDGNSTQMHVFVIFLKIADSGSKGLPYLVTFISIEREDFGF